MNWFVVLLFVINIWKVCCIILENAFLQTAGRNNVLYIMQKLSWKEQDTMQYNIVRKIGIRSTSTKQKPLGSIQIHS